MKVIHKFPLITDQRTILGLPIVHQVVHTGLDADAQPCIWVELDPNSVKINHAFHIVGTGMEYDELRMKHVGTFIELPFVWHVLERI